MQVFMAKGLSAVATKVRDTMIEAAARLLSRGGLPGASFADVLEASGAPRGSVYYHFPGGKRELVTEAVRYTGARVLESLRRSADRSAVAVTRSFADLWRQVLVGSDLAAGCPVAAVVTSAGDDPELVAAAAEAFRGWREELAALLAQRGVPRPASAPLATTIVSAMEGAILLSRAEASMAPFEAVASHLQTMTSQAVRPGPAHG
jgi:TetR/AcrR family transcriptional regulator, lmrAB and yxaGH operons repressor